MASNKTMTGTLYGVGVGPGDPELMTVKAWRLISMTKTISYLAANGETATARAIAAPFIDEGTTEIIIEMPMRVERAPAQEAYNRGAAQIAEALASGTDVVFLCEGDPFFYGSFMYIHERLKDGFPIVVVPGVTSLTASAAAMSQPLCHRDDVLKVIPATLPADRLHAELQSADAIAILKVGRHFGKVKSVLQAEGLEAFAITKATHADQQIRNMADIDQDQLPYFTTIIARHKPVS
jgi:precorrin-2/cobalt-factor-2 C20-methyltransferase